MKQPRSNPRVRLRCSAAPSQHICEPAKVTGSACSDQPSISLGLLRLDCRWFGSFVVFGLLGLSEIANALSEEFLRLCAQTERLRRPTLRNFGLCSRLAVARREHHGFQTLDSSLIPHNKVSRPHGCHPEAEGLSAMAGGKRGTRSAARFAQTLSRRRDEVLARQRQGGEYAKQLGGIDRTDSGRHTKA